MLLLAAATVAAANQLLGLLLGAAVADAAATPCMHVASSCTPFGMYVDWLQAITAGVADYAAMSTEEKIVFYRNIVEKGG